ncbi:MAG: tRNA (N6-threonylcarbamoyladenosine(37)-N6)-methyltransferase TrmO [Oscillospiraceae bacterium]
MDDSITLKVIARIRNDFPTKFGVPRQSGLVKGLRARIVFEPEYRSAEALRGIEGFTHIWLLWGFSENRRDSWSPTVRPPRLGGNKRMGVFATRSPFRPNPVGLSSVELIGTEQSPKDGTTLLVSGADLMDGTPIYDIKPYLAYTDSHPDASGGFTDGLLTRGLKVAFPEDKLSVVPEDKREALVEILRGDPRPSYQDDPERVYGLEFAGYDVHFRVSGEELEVIGVEKRA